MSLRDFINANQTAPPLTRETLDKAMAAMLKQGSVPRHDCRHDGHVAHFMGRTCVYCAATIRELTPDENHIRLGEFF